MGESTPTLIVSVGVDFLLCVRNSGENNVIKKEGAMIERGIVLSLFVFVGVALFLTALCGRRYAITRDERYRDSHMVCASGAFILMVAAIGSVELVKLAQGSLGHGAVLAVHLLFAIPFFFLFVLAFFLVTGIRAPRYHRVLVYPCLFLFAAAFIVGAAMLLGIAS